MQESVFHKTRCILIIDCKGFDFWSSTIAEHKPRKSSYNTWTYATQKMLFNPYYGQPINFQIFISATEFYFFNEHISLKVKKKKKKKNLSYLSANFSKSISNASPDKSGTSKNCANYPRERTTATSSSLHVGRVERLEEFDIVWIVARGHSKARNSSIVTNEMTLKIRQFGWM